MAQFSLHKNKNAGTRSTYPYLLDIQSDLLSDLNTRVVVPLTKVASLGRKPIKDLTPVVEIERQKFLCLVPQMAGISKTELGAIVADLSTHRAEIVAAIDFLVTGT